MVSAVVGTVLMLTLTVAMGVAVMGSGMNLALALQYQAQGNAAYIRKLVPTDEPFQERCVLEGNATWCRHAPIGPLLPGCVLDTFGYKWCPERTEQAQVEP